MPELESLGWNDRLSTLYEPFAGDDVEEVFRNSVFRVYRLAADSHAQAQSRKGESSNDF